MFPFFQGLHSGGGERTMIKITVGWNHARSTNGGIFPACLFFLKGQQFSRLYPSLNMIRSWVATKTRREIMKISINQALYYDSCIIIKDLAPTHLFYDSVLLWFSIEIPPPRSHLMSIHPWETKLIHTQAASFSTILHIDCSTPYFLFSFFPPL